MRASIIIAAHNEGDLLWRTVRSCVLSTTDLDYEIVVSDDASEDGSVAALERFVAEERRRSRAGFPEVRVLSSRERRGTSPAKDRGARAARGDVLLFLDGHTRPQRGAVRRLVEDVESLEGRAVFIPRIPALDPRTFRFVPDSSGYGFCMELLNFECAWLRPNQLARRGRFYECPATIGCCLAVSRELYESAFGFDSEMLEWGIEDIDFGFKAWLLGHDILVDPRAAIAHRFRIDFDTYTVSSESILANKLRMARKNFVEPVFDAWVEYTRSVEQDEVWEDAWWRFREAAASVERERESLMERRVRDEFEYAERYGLLWPRRGLSPSL